MIYPKTAWKLGKISTGEGTKERKRSLLVITQTDVLAVGTCVDDSLGSLGMVC